MQVFKIICSNYLEELEQKINFEIGNNHYFIEEINICRDMCDDYTFCAFVMLNDNAKQYLDHKERKAYKKFDITKFKKKPLTAVSKVSESNNE